MFSWTFVFHNLETVHNFEHAVYSTRAVSKLFSNLKTPKATSVNDHPIIYFSCLFAAMIYNLNYEGT